MDTQIWYLILAALVGGGIGILIGRQMMAGVRAKYEAEAEEKAAMILKNAELQAETIKKNRILEAKEEYLKLKTEFEESTNQKRTVLLQNENKLKQREQQLNQQADGQKTREAELNQQRNEVGQQKNGLAQQIDALNKRREDVDRRQQEADRMMAD